METKAEMLVKTRQHKSGLHYYYNVFKTFYEFSPVNFSVLTGLRHLDIPRLKGNLLTGRYSQIRRDGPLDNILEAAALAAQHPSGACYFWIGIKEVLFVTKPQHIKQLLVFNDDKISRAIGLTESVAKVFGKSIFFSQGNLWQHKRILWKQWFYKRALKSMALTTKSLCEKHIRQLRDKETVDLEQFFTTFTLDVIGHCLLANDDIPVVADQLARLLTNALQKATDPQYAIIDKLLTLGKRCTKKPLGYEQIAEGIKTFFVKNVLKPHLSQLKETSCLLKAIYEMYSEDNQDPLQNDEYLADAMFLAFAGHSTTATTFQFVVKCLAQFPDIAEKLHQELSKHLAEKELNIENIDEIEYLDWIIKETLRLYPPVPLLSRGTQEALTLINLPVSAKQAQYQQAVKDPDLYHIHVAKGTSVIISPYITHRLPALYSNPEQFYPERFRRDQGSTLSDYGYIPFGQGTHNCVGQKFALQELKLLLATLYYHYRIEVVNNDMTVNLKEVVLTPKIKPFARFIPRAKLNHEIVDNPSFKLIRRYL